MNDAWPAGDDDIFFVGSDPSPDGGATASPVRRVLHWSHGCWTSELTINGGINAEPRIAGTAPDDVWLTASDVVYHRDAGGWAPLDPGLAAGIAPLPGNVLVLTDVQPRTRGDIWFTSSAEILHLLNGQWHKQQLSFGPPGESGSISFGFNTISIVSENDVWIGGGSDQIGNTMDPASLYHFDGQNWTIHGVGAYNVNALWPTGARDSFWMALPPDAVEPLSIRRYDAGVVSVPAVAGWSLGDDVRSLWGRAANDVWGAGADVAHFDGSSWSRVADVPDGARQRDPFYAHIVVTGDGNATWLAGLGPRFFRKAAGANP